MPGPDSFSVEGFATPPGTVALTKDNGERAHTGILLHPKPTTDPNDPLNWSHSRKMLHFVPVLIITATIFTQFTIPTIFWLLWIKDFNCTYEQLNNAQAVGIVGTATGCVVFIPLAIKYGRRPVYLISLALMTAMAGWQASMTSITEVYVSYLIGGLAGATNETIVQMTIADIFFVHQRGTANGLYMTMVMIGSYLSPIAAGHMAQYGDWRQCFWVLFGLQLAMFIFFAVAYEESKYIPRITAQIPSHEEPATTEHIKKVMSGQKSLVNDSSSVSIHARSEHIDSTIPVLTWREKMRLLTETDESLWILAYTPAIVLFKFPTILYTAFQYAFSLCWISALGASMSIVFPYPPYNFTTAGLGNLSLGPFTGCILGVIYGGLLSDRTVLWSSRRNHGYYEPEMRLQLCHLPAFCISGGLIMFGVTTSQGMHWIYPSVGGALFGFGIGSICDIALSVAIDSYRAITGEAFVGVAFLRNIFSIAIYFALVPWMKAQGLRNMFIVIGVWALVVHLLHIPLLLWGKSIRIKTAPRYLKMAAERQNARI